eukprot:TRINITY_DN12847_c0_g1_i2.p2 TRINITY_DN12847_c0_g1~~TRINITY_DN12847_c0_g1_i2.p2  ORF type:complete len:193 (+),score=39.28 TRINITY_DN12847_c0_g1_i2:1136-1714(+)
MLSDPLWQGTMTVQLGNEMLTCAELVMTHADDITVPLLMLHGDRDAVSSHEATSRFWNGVRTDSKRLMIITGGFHELHSDKKGDEWLHQITAHLAKWVTESVHVGTRSWKDAPPDAVRSLYTLRKASVSSWFILLKRHKYKLMSSVLLYLICGLIKLKWGRTSLVRVLFWPWFVSFWATQKAFDLVDRPLTI